MQKSIELNKTINLPCGGQDFSNTDHFVDGLACKYMRVVIEYCKHSSKIEKRVAWRKITADKGPKTSQNTHQWH